ncbi:hypothetical protein CEXT_75791 [Caerostris extrusa]|uniref:Uncharacterized protein n=1 Tax=Caerostris extrusa TaxID=172846 RepID=A0AAV4W9F3_CAEEX|nr:hypothetical protein CEXT_75791 [Caerostris extrusa]
MIVERQTKSNLPRIPLVPLYRFLDRMVKISTYFICNSWTYEVGNFWSLQRMVNNKEKEMCGTTWVLLSVGPLLRLKFDKKSKEERIKSSRRVYFYSIFIQVIVIFFPCWLLFKAFLLLTQSTFIC